MLSKNKITSGVYFGEKEGVTNAVLRLCGYNRSVIKSMSEEGHIAICGGSGSGKSSCIVIPTLARTWKGRFFAIDIKGDIKANYDKMNPDASTKVFSLRGDVGSTYDPFEFLRNDGDDNLVANMRELVNAILPMPVDIKDPLWVQSAREILTASLLYYYDLGLIFIDAIMIIMTTPPSELIEKIGECGNENARICVNNFIGNANLSDSKFLMGVCQEITNRLSIFASDPRVDKTLVPSENQVKWQDLETHNIFLSVPEDRLEQYAPVLTMMITQLIRTLERRPEKYSAKGAYQTPILLMLDEFPRLGKMEVLTSAVSTLRSKNVTVCMVFQSLAQLDKTYGSYNKRILLDNCTYKAILNAGDYESQKYFSDLCGSISVKHISRSTSYDNNNKKTGYSDHQSESREPAIYPHEFATLNDIVLMTPQGYTRVKKAPYYKTDFTTKLRATAAKIIGRINNIFNQKRRSCNVKYQ